MLEKIVKPVMNGLGIRDTGHVLGVSKDTVTKVLKKTEKFAKPINKAHLKDLEDEKETKEK